MSPLIRGAVVGLNSVLTLGRAMPKMRFKAVLWKSVARRRLRSKREDQERTGLDLAGRRGGRL